MSSRLLITALALLLAACDIPGMGPDPRIAQREAEGKAIGGACRQALRGIEDCYTLNEKASKTAVFAGWKEMDEYMRENKIEGQRPAVGKDKAEGPPPAGEKDGKEEILEDKKSSPRPKEKTTDVKPKAADKNGDKATEKAAIADKPAAQTDKH